MSYKSEIERVQNDYGYYLNFKLEYQDENKVWQAVDLTGYSAIKVFIGETGKTAAKVVGDCDPVGDLKNGLCRYKVKGPDPMDFDESDVTYEIEIEVSYGAPVTEVVTAKGLSLYIASEMAETEA